MAALIGILALIVGIVSLVCWIWTIVVAFQHKEVVLGIVSICPLVGFIVGWVKHKEWGHKQVMVWWTIAVIANIVLSGLNIGLGGSFAGGAAG